MKSLIADIMQDIIKHSVNTLRTRGISSGLFEIDNLTNGFKKSDLVVFSGMTKSYKTSLLLNLATNIASATEKKVFYISSDSSIMNLARQVLFQTAGVKNTLEKGIHLNDLEFQLLFNIAEILGDSGLKLIKLSPGTIQHIETICKDVYEVAPEIIFIDYLQYLRDTFENNGSEECALLNLKKLATKLEIPIIVASLEPNGNEVKYQNYGYHSDIDNFFKHGADSVFFLKKCHTFDFDKLEERHFPCLEIFAAIKKSGINSIIKIPYEPGSLKFYNSKKAITEALRPDFDNLPW